MLFTDTGTGFTIFGLLVGSLFVAVMMLRIREVQKGIDYLDEATEP
jgi:hypothetical protein